MNLNDTEFDQTFNLNVSYEIVPDETNKTSVNGSQIFETYDVIELLDQDTIDCNNLTEQEPEQQETDEIIQSVAEEEAERQDESVAEYEPDFVGEEEQDNKEPENLTVLVPNELNKIEDEGEVKEVAVDKGEPTESQEHGDESLKKIIEEITNTVPYVTTTTSDPQVFQQSEINMSEKFKILNSKMPNYFLGQKDMEKSMKELQNNYFEVKYLKYYFFIPNRKVTKFCFVFLKKVNSKENCKASNFVKYLENTEKTTDIIKNQIATKKCNLDRIQKIFNS